MIMKSEKMNVSGADIFKKSKIIGIEFLEKILEQFENCDFSVKINEIQGFDHSYRKEVCFLFREWEKR